LVATTGLGRDKRRKPSEWMGMRHLIAAGTDCAFGPVGRRAMVWAGLIIQAGPSDVYYQNGTTIMGLPSREELAKRYLEGARKSYGAKIEELTTDVDNLLTNSVAVDDQQKLHQALHELFGKVADAKAALEAIEDYQAKRGL